MFGSAIRCVVLTGLLLAVAAPGRAEVREVRIAQQFGIGYLPLIVMKHDQLVEKAAAKEGVPGLKVTWAQFGAGNSMNDALLSGNLDFPSGGVGPLLTIWSKTKGHQDIRGVAALNSMPLYLVTTDPKVKTIKDFTDDDKIALPAVKVSIQAVTLEMAAAKAFGPDHDQQLDRLTVSMKHPDALAALLSGHSEITAHFGSPPFQYQELEDKRAHRVLSSYDVLGGPHTFNLVWTTKQFHDANPRVYAAFLAALDQAMALIKAHPQEAAKIYIEEEKSKLPATFLEKMIRDPEVAFTTTPQRVMEYAAFMHKTGAIANMPKSWHDLFFPEIHTKQGS
jgi:NitT/TauT family transport system substrate-binding protein